MVNRKQKTKRIYYISTLKLLLTAFVNALFAGILLFVLLIFVFGAKMVLNGIEILDSIDTAIIDIQLRQESAEYSTDYKYISLVSYLAFLHNETGENYEKLVAFSDKYYPAAMTFVLSSEGTFLTEEPDRLGEYKLDFKEIFKEIKDDVNTTIPLPGCKAYNSQMENGNYFVSIVDNQDNYLTSEVSSPQEAINSVMSRNGIKHNDENHAYLRFNQTGAVYTEDGYFEAGKAPEFLNGDLEFPITDTKIVGGIEQEVNYYISLFVKDGKPYYSISKHNDYLDADITFYSYPAKELRADENITFTVEISYIILLIIFSLFVYYLRQYSWLHPEIVEYSPKINNRKILIGITMALITIAAAAYFSQTLFLLSSYVLDDDDDFAAIKASYSEKLLTNERVDFFLKEEITTIDSILAESIGKYPKIVSRKNLEEITDIFGLQYIILYDIDGNETISSNTIRNYSFPTDKEDPAYCFNTLKTGLGPVLTDRHENPLCNALSIRSAINIYDPEENPVGYLESSIYPITFNTLDSDEVLGVVLKTMMLSNASNYYVVNPENSLVTYSPNDVSTGALAPEVGFTAESLKPDFFGRLTLNGLTCYVTNRSLDNQLIYIIHPEELVYLTRVPYTIAVTLLFFMNLLSMLWFLRSRRRRYSQVIYASKQQDEAIHQAAQEEEVPEEEKSGKLFALLEQLDSIKISWMYQTPEKKLAIAFKSLIEIGAVMLLMACAYRLFTNRDDSLLLRILSGRWAKGINVFSLTANIISFLVMIVIAAFIRWCLRMIGQISDARGETVTRLLRSATSYISVIVLIYISLVNIGLNPSALVTSAGLVGVAIGIGARDLITDIIAGLFIIFEGSFQVGDIINVGGYEGTVREIGIRTTRVTGWDLNIKTINNRNMSNIVNMSAKKQISIFYFRVPYTVSEETLRSLLEKKLIEFRKKYPVLISYPYLSIVKSSLSGMMECRVVTEIPAQNRAIVEKNMIEDVEKILADNDIPAIFEQKPKDSTSASIPKNSPEF